MQKSSIGEFGLYGVNIVNPFAWFVNIFSKKDLFLQDNKLPKF